MNEKELLKIWDNKENSNKDLLVYEKLNNDEKIRLFDLLENRKPINIKELKGGLN